MPEDVDSANDGRFHKTGLAGSHNKDLSCPVPVHREGSGIPTQTVPVGEALEPGNEGGRDGHLTRPNLTLDLER